MMMILDDPFDETEYDPQKTKEWFEKTLPDIAKSNSAKITIFHSKLHESDFCDPELNARFDKWINKELEHINYYTKNMKQELIDKAIASIPDQFSAIHTVSSDGESNSIWIMHKKGIAFCRIYWYNNDESYICLDHLMVKESHRNNGIGTLLQELRENIGHIFDAKDSYLWCLKDSWMRDWYNRRGYEDFNDHETEKNAIWMIKKLK